MQLPSTGSIHYPLIKNRSIALRQAISLISQKPTLLLQESIFNNIALPLHIQGYSPDYIKSKVNTALRKVGLAQQKNNFAQVSVSALSLGEQHRVSIARAIINKPKILLADEPTAHLDPKLAKSIINLLHQFTQYNVTTIITTHNLNLIPPEAHVFSLDNGKIVRYR